MKKIGDLTVVFLIALGCVAASTIGAIAQTDPNPNSVGIYFDENAIVNTQDVMPPGVATAYVIATRYEGVGGVDAWRGGVSCELPMVATIRGGGVNSFSNGPDYFLHFDVACGTPLPFSTSIVLAELSVNILTEDPVMLFLESSADGEGWVCSSAGVETFLHPSVPCPNLPCLPAWVASINSAGPVLSDTVFWDGIKSLYR